MGKSFVLVCGIVFGLLAMSPPKAASQEKSTSLKLEVHVHYTGSGTVDEQHNIYVVLWDSPDFMRGDGRPVDMKPTVSKQGRVAFDDVKKTPAYVSVAFDPKGAWDPQSGPPTDGSSLGVYSKTPGKPEPIDLTPGKTVSIELAFDDSVKMQSGKPTR